jgi:hypothetical protein
MRGGFGRPFFMPGKNKSFAAVTIVTGANRCAAVQGLADTRILATQAPTLPVPNCTMPGECRCRFRKYVDRREDAEGRRFKFGQERSAWYAGGQRRKSRGRREED